MARADARFLAQVCESEAFKALCSEGIPEIELAAACFEAAEWVEFEARFKQAAEARKASEYLMKGAECLRRIAEVESARTLFGEKSAAQLVLDLGRMLYWDEKSIRRSEDWPTTFLRSPATSLKTHHRDDRPSEQKGFFVARLAGFYRDAIPGFQMMPYALVYYSVCSVTYFRVAADRTYRELLLTTA